MAKQLLLIFVLLLLILGSVKSQFEDLLFTGFSHAGNNISLDGAAEIQENGILQLTNDTLRVMGHAFYSYPIQFKNSSDGQLFSFSTAFAFSIVPQYPTLGGHGLAFTISSTKDLHKALPSQYLGLLSASNVGNFSNHLFAVEFDTVQDFEFGDIDDNHVGIDINSLTSNKSAPAAYFAENLTKEVINLKSGQTIQAWIDYDCLKHQLSVKLSTSSVKPKSSILSLDVDLSTTLKRTMYVGFSSSTGLLASSHYIMGWSFKINGEARSLDISQLPSLPAPEKSHTALILGVCIAAALLTISAIAFAFYMIRKIRDGDIIEEWEFNVGPNRYSYNELKQATKGFKDKNVLGFGGFGKVYKGTLPKSDIQVAVKRISHESKQGLREFLSEVSSIGRLRHKNLVQLLGWCRKKGDLLLVYDFMPNGSLDKYLFDNPGKVLTWQERMKIIKGVVSGLLYLHEEWEQAVIHRDIKAGNVLLDSDMNGRLGDFGLARLYEHGSNPNTTKVVGTLGYLAPELTKTGKPTTSSDVFAFGTLLLEVVCGRRPVESKALPEELILLDWIWDKWHDGAILDVVDKKLNGQYDAIEAVLVLRLGLMCSSDAAEARLTMRQVVRYLEGEAVMPDEVIVPEGCDREKDRALEECMHSYKVSTESCSFTEDIDDRIVDLEACSASSSSPPVGGNGRRYQ